MPSNGIFHSPKKKLDFKSVHFYMYRREVINITGNTIKSEIDIYLFYAMFLIIDKSLF